MPQETAARVAVANARDAVNRSAVHLQTSAKLDVLVALADVEVRAEQARQQELANMIAMLATPAACPYPGNVVRERIKELTKLEN